MDGKENKMIEVHEKTTQEIVGDQISSQEAYPAHDQFSVNAHPADAHLLTHDQFQRELSYRVALSILRKVREADLITQKEFVTIAPTLAEKFSPVWGGLYQLSA